MSRKMFRVLANVQGHITDNLNWAAGVNFWNWDLDDMKDRGVTNKETGETIKQLFKSRMNVTPRVAVIALNTLPRSEKKTRRVFDHRAE